MGLRDRFKPDEGLGAKRALLNAKERCPECQTRFEGARCQRCPARVRRCGCAKTWLCAACFDGVG